MNDTVETVFVDTKNGPVRMNKADYEADQRNDKPKLKLSKDQNPNPVKKDDGGNADAVGPDGKPLVTADQMTNSERVPVLTPVDPSATNADNANQQMLVSKDGKKFFVVDQTGNKITREGIDAEGYGSEKDAWEAVTALQLKQQGGGAAQA